MRGKETDSNLSGYCLDETDLNSTDQSVDDEIDDLSAVNAGSDIYDGVQHSDEEKADEAKGESMEKVQTENDLKEHESSGHEADDERD